MGLSALRLCMRRRPQYVQYVKGGARRRTINDSGRHRRAAQGTVEGEVAAAAGEEGELEGEGGAAVISTDSMTALRLLFGPLPPEAVLSTDDGGGDDALAMLSRWCPLPLYTPPPDSV